MTDTSKMTNCPNCGNHCPKDALRCGRGRAFFAQDGAETENAPHAEDRPEQGREHGGEHSHGEHGHGEHGRGFGESQSSNPLVQTLSKAAAVAEHKGEMMRAHGKDESEMFSALTPEEQQLLSSLLTKQLDAWAADHAAHHQR